MADTAINLEYASKTRLLVLQAMRVTFPIWVALPAGLLFLSIGQFFSNGSSFFVPFLLRAIITGMIVLGCLTFIRFLEKSKITIDKNGLEFPAELPLLPTRYVSWQAVRRVFADIAGGRLLLYEKSPTGENNNAYTATIEPVVINLERMQSAEIEQLLVSVDVFAPHAELDNSVAELKSQVKESLRLEAAQGHLQIGQPEGISYTELWEQELSRRFRAAAFMPLEVNLIMRNGSLTIVRHLALGGLSAVYLAQLQSKQLVTLKESVIPEGSNPELKAKAAEMFAREAQLLMRLSHPNIVAVLDYFVENERSYLMLDYVSGLDLRQYVKQNGLLREPLAIEWALQIARVMEYLHGQDPPILHRDLTPDNMVARPDGQIIVIDFGAANEFIGNATGTFVGKQSFIAPEQFRGQASKQSDIYAFGGTLYYLLTATDPEALSQSDPAAVKSDLSEAICGLVRSCTSLEECDRPTSASAIVQELIEMSKATESTM